ncbi:MAG: DUF4339 domain-containing protein [Armatimonadetes bacterium]|nr:DUF4339 domain-containing protein [Armatimonadota bacterium]
MNYFVIGNDGQKYGPADIATLNQWAQEGRLTPTTMLEDAATGQQTMASQMPGISFPVAAPGAPSYGPTYQAGNFTPGGMMDDGSGDITKVWIFSALSLLCCPIIFGILAIVYASNAQKKGHPQGQTAMIVAVVALVLGLGAGFVLNMGRFMGR